MGKPRFIATDGGYALQELREDGYYFMVARVANAEAARFAALLNERDQLGERLREEESLQAITEKQAREEVMDELALSNPALTKILCHTVGVVGYFDCSPTNVRTYSDRVVVEWDHWGVAKELVFDRDGNPQEGH